MRLIHLTLASLLAITAQAQSPSFEAVSIKPNPRGGDTSTERTTPGRLMATNVTVGELIQFAFGVRDFQLSGGPGWLRDDRFDIAATTGSPIELTDSSLKPYLLSLLSERAGFRYHIETKELQVYSLTNAKNGPRLAAHTGEPVDSTHEISHSPGKTQMTATNATMANLANLLNRELSRPVIDSTGIKGGYDLTLEWSPDPTAETSGPSLFTALQTELGLKLESTKGPVEIIVIDRIGRPSEN